MPRTLTTAMRAYLNGETFSGAICVKITRLDGTIMGFTTWDQDIIYNDGSGSLTYKANNAFFSMALKQVAGSSVDNSELIGSISSTDISDTDILAGKYDTSKYQFIFVIPTDLTALHIILSKGTIGDVRMADTQYTTELRSLAQPLQNQIGELTSPTCRVRRLGDARCNTAGLFGNGNTLAFYRVNAVVVSYTGSTIVLSGTYPIQVTSGSDPGWYTDGLIHMTSGIDSGLEQEIKTWSYAGGQVTAVLQEGFGYPPQVGDTCYIEAGCDRLIATCGARFGNQLNYRGEPDIPGTDQVLSVGRG